MYSWDFWLDIVATQLKIRGSSYIYFVIRMKKNSVVKVGSKLNQQSCLVGAYCSHAVLTVKIGVYRCPFGECFKKLESQKHGGS